MFSFVNFYFSIIFSGLWNNSFSSAAEALFYLVIFEIIFDMFQYAQDWASYSVWIDKIADDTYFSDGKKHLDKVEEQISILNKKIRAHRKKTASLDTKKLFEVSSEQRKFESWLARLRRVLVALKEQEMDKNMNQQYIMKKTDQIDEYY